MPGQSGVYSLKDPGTGETFNVHLDHSPSVAESLGIIQSERAKRTAASAGMSGVEKQDQQGVNALSPLQKSEEFLKGEVIDAPIAIAKGLGTQVMDVVRHPLGEPNQGQPFTVRLPSGKTSTVYNPYENQNPLPVSSDTIRHPIQALHNLEELAGTQPRAAGEKFGLPVLQGAALAAPFAKGEVPIKAGEVPESTALTTTRRVALPSDSVISSEVIKPGQKVLSPSNVQGSEVPKVTSPSLSSSEGGIVGQLSVKAPAKRLVLPEGTPEVKPPIQIQRSSTEPIQVGPSSLEGNLPKEAVPPKETIEKTQQTQQTQPLTEAINLSPEQQTFIQRGGKITKLPPGRAEGAEELTGKVHGEETGRTQKILKQRMKDLAKELMSSEEGTIDFGKIKDAARGIANLIRTGFKSPSRTLESDPEIGGMIKLYQRQDLIARRLGNEANILYRKITKGLNESERVQLNEAVQNPSLYVPEKIRTAASKLHRLNEQYHSASNALAELSSLGLDKPTQMGHVENYMPQVRKRGIAQRAYDWAAEYNPVEEELQGKRKSNLPIAPAMMHRAGDIPESELEKDPNKFMPQYYAVTASALARRPAVRNLNQLIEDTPYGSKLANIKNFTNQLSGHEPILDVVRAINTIPNLFTRLSTKALLWWNPGIQQLHAASIASMVAPELGPVGFKDSLTEFAKNPKKYLKIVNIFQPPERGWEYSLGSKVDQIGQLGNIGFRASEAMAFPGYYKLALQEGYKGQQAYAEAMRRVYRSFGVPMRGDDPLFLQLMGAIPGFGPLTTRFVRIPYNLMQNYVERMNPDKLKLLVGTLAAGLAIYEVDKQTHLRLFHLNPTNILFSSQLTQQQLKVIFDNAKKGKWDKVKTGLIRLIRPTIIPAYKRGGAGELLKEYERPVKAPRGHGLNMPVVKAPQVRINTP
jgi:hypothetical protein